MDEPPAKRPRRDEGGRDIDTKATASPRSPMPHDDRRSNGYDSRRRDRDDYSDRKRKRSRSRSPQRDKYSSRRDRSRERDRHPRNRDYRSHRDRSRDKDRDKDRDHKSKRYSRSRSRSPRRNGETPRRARSPLPRSDHDRPPKTNGVSIVKVEDIKDAEDPDAIMKQIMGFGMFRTTKNTKVPGNQIYGVRKEKKTEYRQYMNRVGGFNRPLSPSK